jgi:hypothetical protein
MLATFPSDTVNTHVEAVTDWIMTTEEARLFLLRNRGLANLLVLMDHGRALVCVDHTTDWSFTRAERLARQKGYDRFVWVNADGQPGEGRLRGTGRYEPVARRLLSFVA